MQNCLKKRMKNIKNIFKKMNTQENEEVNEQNEPQQEEMNAEDTDPKDTKIAELEAKVNELNDKYLRLYSEFDNFRKRTAKEKTELIQSGGEDVFKSILPVMDDFERAIKSNSETSDVKAVNDGVNLIYNKLKSTLTQKGLEPMNAMGAAFDPDIHEAITNIPAPSEELKGKVVDELEKGYSLNGKIIRFAKVVIGQ
jgi:molecular chaperone GrpE